MNPHEVLGVDESVSDDALRRRLRILSKMFHPDKHQNDKSAVFFFQLIQKSFKSIQESRTKIVIPDVSITPKPSASTPRHPTEEIDSTSQLSESAIRTLSHRLHDPWFQPEFSLTEFFGDVSIPKEKHPPSSTSNNAKPPRVEPKREVEHKKRSSKTSSSNRLPSTIRTHSDRISVGMP